MISICLPVYNFDITQLVKELSLQAGKMNIPSEIIVIDDKSDDLYRIANASVCADLTYIQLDKNVGRSRIRNLFLKHAKYKYLLFLDCDSLVTSPGFITDYLEFAESNQDSVICGGRIFQPDRPERSLMLRWKYGVFRESKPADVRNESAHESFMSNNFLISKDIFKRVNFDEELYGYGYEDTLFGFDLKQKAIPVIHIDNHVLNGHLETNIRYLKNIEEGMMNLVSILQRRIYNIDFINHVKILRYLFGESNRTKRTFLKSIFILVKPLIKLMLASGFVSLTIFDFYKSGTLLLLEKTAKSK
jgi:glycosyltransferase involved in cell wall biosynthesis